MRLLYDPPEREKTHIEDYIPEDVFGENPDRLSAKTVGTGGEEKYRLSRLQDEEERRKKELEERRKRRIQEQSEEMLRRSVSRSKEILDEAHRQGAMIKEEAKEEGRKQGLEEGREEGRREALEEGTAAYQKKLEELQKQFAGLVRDMDRAKEKVLDSYLEELKDVALAIAEKIIRVSMKNSSDIVKKMILSATEKLKKTSWVKIYVAKDDQGMELRGDQELLAELSRISDNVKIVMMDEAEEGTCIIEMPDEIIDASIPTQLENVKDILNNARL